MHIPSSHRTRRPGLAWLGLLLAAGCSRDPQQSVSHPGPTRVEATITDASSAGVGRRIPDIAFVDTDGRPGKLSDYTNHMALVIALRDTECPLSRKYGPTLARIEAACATQNIAFLYLNCATPNTAEAIQRERQSFGFRGRYVHEPQGTFGSTLGAHTTTEVFVLDRARTLRYRGAVDDQYGLGYSLAQPQERFLERALADVLQDHMVRIKATSAPGCLLDLPPAPAPAVTNLTYHNEISRILQNHCVGCHHVGGVGPFPLLSLDDIAARRKMIKYVVEKDIMPPWKPTPGSGPWLNDPSLSPTEKAQLLAWIDAGAPAGDPADAPVPARIPDGWTIGIPDVIVEIPAPHVIPAQGTLPYSYSRLALPFKEDTWIQAAQVIPTAMRNTHHVLVFIEPDERPSRAVRALRRLGILPPWRPALRTYFAKYVPGFNALTFPPGTAKRIPAGTHLLVQIHYVTTGEPATNHLRVGLILAKQPPEFEVETVATSDTKFVIPAGAPNHEVKGEYKIRKAGQLVSFFPHMHYRGKAFRYDLVGRDGVATNVLNVPSFDFNWQWQYDLSRPIAVHPGMRMQTSAWYDNSPNNPANPDPSSDVTFGLQTTNEMMIGYFDLLTPVESD